MNPRIPYGSPARRQLRSLLLTLLLALLSAALLAGTIATVYTLLLWLTQGKSF